MSIQNYFHKTRLAPTPSGYLHLGNVFSFALTAALAQHADARILLRIDDMDRERVNEAYLRDIFETLSFLGIPWQEGPRGIDDFERRYSQRHRLPLYEEALERLRQKGLLYACNCSRAQIQKSGSAQYPGTCRDKQIPLNAPDVAWRLRTSAHETVNVRTLHGLISARLPEEMQDVIVRKKDGFPAYQLSSLVDDLNFGIDFIVRGQDLWPSTLMQLYLAGLLGENRFQETIFYHHDLIMDTEDRKLSKSAGDTSIHYLRHHGSKATDIYALLGKQLGFAEAWNSWHDLDQLLLK